MQEDVDVVGGKVGGEVRNGEACRGDEPGACCLGHGHPDEEGPGYEDENEIAVHDEGMK